AELGELALVGQPPGQTGRPRWELVPRGQLLGLVLHEQTGGIVDRNEYGPDVEGRGQFVQRADDLVVARAGGQADARSDVPRRHRRYPVAHVDGVDVDTEAAEAAGHAQPRVGQWVGDQLQDHDWGSPVLHESRHATLSDIGVNQG